ncbi:MAG TPA: hypothetical protein VFR60_11085, partial [Sphingomicrobium sp.]|nr:hypothetical protein [Sphingomicrobium sp.]
MLKRLILVVAALGLLAGAGGFWLLWASPGPKPGPHRVTVEEGSALASVARQLDEQGVIPGDATTYRVMARLFGSSDPV